MTRNIALMLVAALGLQLPIATPPASARVWTLPTRDFDESDVDAIQTAVQKMASEDAVGASRTWRSNSGRAGRVYLVAGGEKAGSAQARVRITRMQSDREVRVFTFRYCKTSEKGWATCG